MENSIVAQLLELASSGTEENVRLFVRTHWAEFPPEVKDFLAVALMSDALKARAIEQLSK